MLVSRSFVPVVVYISVTGVGITNHNGVCWHKHNSETMSMLHRITCN